jgi:hypothetical protein
MAIQWKIVRSGFLDGFSAHILMFRQVRAPGSLAEELNRLTTPEMLAEYSATKPDFGAAILKLRDDELARDRSYTRMIRVVGTIQLAATILAAGFLVFHYRF